MSRTFFRLLALAAVSGALIAGQDPKYRLRVDVPFVSLDLTVQDASGNTVTNLSRDSFEVLEDGVAQEIVQFFSVATPYNILLLFDRSGSVQDRWLVMQRAVAGFIGNLRPQDRMEIATFDYEFEVQSPWTSDRKQSLMALPRLIRGDRLGETWFYRAVEDALRKEFKKATGRRALVVLTDGRDVSLYKDAVARNRLPEPKADRRYQAALKAAQTMRVPVYFVAFNTDRNFEPNTIGGDEYDKLRQIYRDSPMADQYLAGVRVRMEELAAVSGGRMLYPQRLEDIVPLYQEIGTELGTSYTIGYVSTNNASDGSFRRIEVKPRQAGLRLAQSRDGYYAK